MPRVQSRRSAGPPPDPSLRRILTVIDGFSSYRHVRWANTDGHECRVQPRRASQLADPLHRLEQPVVGRGQRDPEEALAACAVGAAGRDHDGRLLEHVLAVGRRRLEPVGDRRPDVDRALRRRDVRLRPARARRRPGRGGAGRPRSSPAPLRRARGRAPPAPASWTASNRPESMFDFSRQYCAIASALPTIAAQRQPVML